LFFSSGGLFYLNQNFKKDLFQFIFVGAIFLKRNILKI